MTKQVGKGQGNEPERDPLRWLKWTALVVLVLVAVALMTVTLARTQTRTNPDSVNVMLEVDPDGDGVYQVRTLFVDGDSIWDRSSRGFMRVTLTTEYDDVPDTTTTDYGHFWRELMSPDDLTGYVDLALFAQFGMTYGDSLTVLPNGSRYWDSPGGSWYYVPNP